MMMNTRLQFSLFGLDRIEEYCILNDWKRPYKILKDYQLGSYFDPDPVSKPPKKPTKSLDPDEAFLNDRGLICHLPTQPTPLSSQPELFTIQRLDGLVTPVHSYMNHCSPGELILMQKRLRDSTSPLSTLGQKLLQRTSVDIIAYRYTGNTNEWRKKQRTNETNTSATHPMIKFSS